MLLDWAKLRKLANEARHPMSLDTEWWRFDAEEGSIVSCGAAAHPSGLQALVPALRTLGVEGLGEIKYVTDDDLASRGATMIQRQCLET